MGARRVEVGFARRLEEPDRVGGVPRRRRARQVRRVRANPHEEGLRAVVGQGVAHEGDRGVADDGRRVVVRRLARGAHGDGAAGDGVVALGERGVVVLDFAHDGLARDAGRQAIAFSSSVAAVGLHDVEHLAEEAGAVADVVECDGHGAQPPVRVVVARRVHPHAALGGVVVDAVVLHEAAREQRRTRRAADRRVDEEVGEVGAVGDEDVAGRWHRLHGAEAHVLVVGEEEDEVGRREIAGGAQRGRRLDESCEDHREARSAYCAGEPIVLAALGGDRRRRERE